MTISFKFENNTLTPNFEVKPHHEQAVKLLNEYSTAVEIQQMLNEIFGYLKLEEGRGSAYVGNLWLSAYLKSGAWREDALTDAGRQYANSFVFGEFSEDYHLFSEVWNYLQSQL